MHHNAATKPSSFLVILIECLGDGANDAGFRRRNALGHDAVNGHASLDGLAGSIVGFELAVLTLKGLRSKSHAR